MPEIRLEDKDTIERLQANANITPGEARFLRAIFSTSNRDETAKKLKIKKTSVYKMTTELIAKGVLIKVSARAVKLCTGEPIPKKTEPRPKGKKPFTAPPVAMTAEERKWMLEHYSSQERSKARKKLGRSKMDINLMAIELGLDQKG